MSPSKTIIYSGLVFLLPIRLFASNPIPSAPVHREIKWQPVFENRFSEDYTFRSLAFTGAVYSEGFIPVYSETFQVDGNASDVNVNLSNVVSEPLKEGDLVGKNSLLKSEFTTSVNFSYRKKVQFATVTIVPIRQLPGTNQFEKLVSFDLSISARGGNARKMQSRYYNQNSVLASGTWYRIAILQDGVFKITYQFLKNLGIDVDSIDPRMIRIYGNGGGILPFANYKPRLDDLHENPILVNGEADGKLDSADYILFYGKGQTKWNYSTSTRQYNHQINYYADTTYYFINIDIGPGKRIQTRSSSTLPSTVQVNSYDDYLAHEAEIYNFLKSGREWYGENFDNLNTTRTFSYTFDGISTSDTFFLRVNLLGRATNSAGHSGNYFVSTINGNSPVTTGFFDVGTAPQDNYGAPIAVNRTFIPSGPQMDLTFQFGSSDPNASGWLNYFEFNFRRALTTSGQLDQFFFRDSRSVGAGQVSNFIIQAPNPSYQVWDVTDPTNAVLQETQYTSGSLTFNLATDELHELALIKTVNYLSPIAAGTIANQNLHGMSKPEMIIVTNPAFLRQANDLADYHRTKDQFRVQVATTEQIFNEFSSGAQDVSAIRDFVKMFYDRALSPADLPKYLCLLGDASYDNKYRISSNTNFVTSYQSAGSLNQTQTYMSDDFFGLLDDSEGDWYNGEIVDMSVGRLPVKTIGEADGVVKKIIHYGGGDVKVADATNPGVLGDWRNTLSFVADDQDVNTHFRQTDTLATRCANTYPVYNIDKIYIDAYNQQTTPGGQRYPDAHQAIVDRVQRGTLLMTYIGHGGEVGWGHERILEVNDINDWSNYNNMAAFLTATCEFTRVDDPGRTSAGEMVFLNPAGGGICLFTTSRLAFSNSNFTLCQKFFTHIFEPYNGRLPTIGELFEQTKIDVYTDPYVRNFLLIGDPALRIAYPKWLVKTNTINTVSITAPTDTLKALARITVTGEIQNGNGAKMSAYNGIIYPTVFDKKETYYTLGNDQNVVNDPSYPAAFTLQKSIIYRGKASVVNGDFTFTFVVPKDIQFQYGYGKLSYYAQNGAEDANGYYSQVVVGGYNSNADADAKGPEVKLYMNDDKFVRGGMTDKNPYLYAVVIDSSGINTVGNGIGHDMTAELDHSTSKVYVLNDYYENNLNSFQEGKVKFPFKDLAAGPHSVTFKVWDVYNNSAEATTDFIVSESATLALDHVLNYPNPFTTHTTFMFEHNRPFTPLDIQVQVFTVSGKLVKTISAKIISEGYRSSDLEWDGLDDYGDRIGKGVYIYKLRVRAQDGDYADKFEKLVILR